MSIASEITDLNTNLTAAKAAVTAKGGTTGNTGLAGLASEIANIPSGGTAVSEKDINFFDYDGTLVESWTLAELQTKSALPSAPAHDGLTSQGWNWTLAELQAENQKTNVGCLYMPTDGKTHIFVDVDADHLTPHLAIGLNGTATIDWGDNTATTTLTGSSIDSGQGSFHTYASAGSYEVTIDIPEGSAGKIRGNDNYVAFLWKGEATQSALTLKNKAYAAQVQKIYIGARLNAITGMNWCGLKYITLHDAVTFPTDTSGGLNNRHFIYCSNLKFFAYPRSASAAIRMFNNCDNLENISFPPNLAQITQAVYACNSIKKIFPPKSLNGEDFTMAIQNCKRLEETRIPTTIGAFSNAFPGCSNLTTLKMPQTITGFYANAIANCSRLWLLDFSDTTAIPSFNGTLDVSDGFQIRVPAALEATWKATAGWSNYASYIVGV